MKVLKTRGEVLPFVHDWVELLAQDRYEEAVQIVGHPIGVVLTAEMLRQLVANYGILEPRNDGRTFCATSPSSAVSAHETSTPYRDVKWDKGENGLFVGHVHFDVPLDGKWSDLTATFWVHERENGYVLQLEDLHVL